MQVQEVMTHSVDLIDPNAKIMDAAIKMRDDNIGALPIGENDRLIGMVTDRDIATRMAAEGKSPGTTAVRDVMSKHIYYCFDSDSLERAAEIMAEHQIRRLPVLNHDKRLVGVIALADLGRVSPDAPDPANKALKGISELTDTPRR